MARESAGQNDEKVSIDGFEFELTNQAKVLFPRDNITKGDLVDYYTKIAPHMLPYMRDRPVTMVRYPDGIDGEHFFQKDASPYFPKWLPRVIVKKKGGTVDHVRCEKPADLAYLANLACVTPHIWLSRKDDLDHPDRMIMDLDPSGDDFGLVLEAAILTRKELAKHDLTAYVMTTGSRGMHIVVPLDRSATFDQVREFAKRIAKKVVTGREDRFTLEMTKEERGDRLLLDTFRNSYGQTGVAPYAVRAKDGAPVATPLTWGEVEEGDVRPRIYNIRNIFKRLEGKGDPWRGIDDHPGRLSKSIQSVLGSINQ